MPRDGYPIPPHALEAEMSVLGGLMLDNRKLDEVIDLLREQDFYTEPHRLIYRAIRILAGQGRPFDWVTVSEALRDDVEDDRKANPQGYDSLERVGGQGFVAQLTLDVPGASNVRAYAEIVQERSIQRQMIAAGLDTVALGQQPDGRKAAELIDEAEQRIFRLRAVGDRSRSGPRPLANLLPKAIQDIEHRASGALAADRTPTGLEALDRKTHGLGAGDLVIVAGRPAMGKSTLALNIAAHVAVSLGKPAVFFSLEMPCEQLALRLVSSLSNVPFEAIRSGDVDDEQWRYIAEADRESQAPLFIDDTGGLSVLELRSRARRIAAKHSLGLVVVDYIQLMQAPGHDSRVNEVAAISRDLKALAKELQVPVIALSQLNRGVENRDEKRPRMADLRESGGIEQDADLIAFVYRDEVYNQASADRGTAEIIIGKHRNGPTGVVRVAAQLDRCRFVDLAPDWRPEPLPPSPPAGRRGGGFAEYRASQQLPGASR